MHFILHSDIGESSIRDKLGRPEYSYYFVLTGLRPVLERMGTVELVRDPETEVDPIFQQCRARGEPCVFLCFAPPNRAPIGLACPTVSVFAWENSAIPTEAWGDEPREDWRVALTAHGRAITLCSFAASAVKAAMGADFPVGVIATPVWDRFAALRARPPSAVIVGAELIVDGIVIDSPTLGLSADLLVPPRRRDWRSEEEEDEPPDNPPGTEPPVAAPEPDPPAAVVPPPPPRLTLRHRFGLARRQLLRRLRGQAEPPPPEERAPGIPLHFDGVVYTAVFGPTDGRKNWHDIVTAFCWAFRDTPDATLILKMVHHRVSDYRDTLILLLSQLSPFACRVVAIQAFLDDAAYRRLIGATSYYVNASLCEGLCLPLMEFMASGTPAIAPRHTAMADYVDAEAAFIVSGTRQYSVWSHDPRQMFRSERYRINWETLLDGFRESYRVAKEEPARYAAMGQAAAERIHRFASEEVVSARLRDFLAEAESTPESTTTEPSFAGALAT